MKREPDWEALADLQFILYNRIAGSLNEALSGIALSDMPEAQDKPPGFWKDRATTKVANVLNLFTAWSYLIRYKMGEGLPERAIRPFPANALLTWLGAQLQLNPPPQTESNPMLHANQETLQEALMLLYSVAFTQGAGVRLELEASRLGMWFRVKFSRTQPLPPTIDELLASFGDHWRAQDTSFELATARDFVQLNGGELMLNSSSAHGEFMFFVRAAGAPKKKMLPPSARAQEPPPQTRPLDPETLERALESTGSGLETSKLLFAKPNAPDASAAPDAAGTPDVETPVTIAVVPAESDPTPVFVDMQTGELSGKTAPAPPLSVLRPLPPTLSEIERQQAARDASEKPGEHADESPDGESDSTGPVVSRTSPLPDAARETSEVEDADTLHLPESSNESAAKSADAKDAAAKDAGANKADADNADAPVIVSLKLPAPALPARLSVPPAATSNSAVTRQTQSLTPVSRESASGPAGDETPRAATESPAEDMPANPSAKSPANAPANAAAAANGKTEPDSSGKENA